jgi:parvulin-like peptidyl-prolyl isomerase
MPLMAQETLVVDGVAAVVGGVRITVADVMEDAKEIIRRERPTQGEMSKAMASAYAEALTNLVSRQLILLRYDQAQQKLPEWAVNRRVESIIEEHFGGDRSLLVSMLSARGISFEKWRKKIKEDTIIAAMRQQFVDSGIAVSPKDIAAAYKSKYANATLPGHVRVAMILLRPENDQSVEDAMAKAETLCDRLQSGKADFAAEARRLSRDSRAGDGGDWGYIEPADALRKELCDALDALEAGQVSRPILVGGDYIYILKKVAVSKDLKVPLDSVYDEIEGDLRQEIGSRRFEAWMETLRRTTTVRILKPTL